MSSKVEDMFDDVQDFEDLLAAAEREAETGWEIDFVADVALRYAEYGGAMFLSDRQREMLEEIAG